MPRKATQSKTAKSVDEKPKKESKPAKTEKVKQTKTPKTPKSTKTEKDVPVPDDELDVSDVDESSTLESKKTRSAPTKESVLEGFDELITVIDEEIGRLRESSQKAKGVKFLRSLGKRVKTLRGQSVRVMKQKQKTNRKNNTNSGFLKPVQISKDMAKFTGWNHDDLKSRVDVTKYICNYIRENNLQNPEDRRQILADKKLAKLLDYDTSSDSKPLTYYRIQTYMKKHFTNPDSKEVKEVKAVAK